MPARLKRCLLLFGLRLLAVAGLWVAVGCTVLDRRGSVGLPPDAVVLTFDDGPNDDPGISMALLEVLRRHQVRAAFCFVGAQVVKHPEVVRAAHADGHLLVNHSFHHRFGILRNPDAIVDDMRAADAALAEALGIPGFRTRHYRPPYGWLAPQELMAMRRYGMRDYLPVTSFEFDTFTGPAEAEALVGEFLDAARKNRGGIFVLHEHRYRPEPVDPDHLESPTHGANRSWVPAAVDRLIRDLKAEGFTFPDPKTLPALDRRR